MEREERHFWLCHCQKQGYKVSQDEGGGAHFPRTSEQPTDPEMGIQMTFNRP